MFASGVSPNDVQTSTPDKRPIVDVVTYQSPDFGVLTGIDDDGRVAAEIAIWTFGDATYIDATFSDGNYLSLVADDHGVRDVYSDDLAGAISQTATVFGVAGQLEERGAVACGSAICAGTFAVMTANVAGAFLGGVAIGCACAYLVGIEEKC